MYIIKDLIPDMSLFYAQYKIIKPWLQRDDEKSYVGGEKQLLQSARDRAKMVTFRSSRQ